MGWLDLFKPKKQEVPKKESSPVQEEPRRKPVAKTAKEKASEAGEPYVAIVSFDLDPSNLHQGAFELDWNDKFVSNLVRAGYQMKPDEEDSVIVDRWFQNVCRHVVLETWEQEQAMNPNRYIQDKPIGNGRREVS